MVSLKLSNSSFVFLLVAILSVACAQHARCEEVLAKGDSASKIATEALFNGPFDPSNLRPEIGTQKGLPRIEYKRVGEFGHPYEAMAIVFTQDEDCLATLREKWRSGEETRSPSQVCRYSWAAEIVRAPVPELEHRWNDTWLHPRERWLSAVRRLLRLINENPAHSVHELVEILPLERISVSPMTCPQSAPNFSDIRDIAWMPDRFANVIFPDEQEWDIGNSYKGGSPILITLKTEYNSSTARGMAEEGTPMFWAEQLMEAFQPCIEAAGFRPLGWSAGYNE